MGQSDYVGAAFIVVIIICLTLGRRESVDEAEPEEGTVVAQTSIAMCKHCDEYIYLLKVWAHLHSGLSECE